MRDLTLNQSSAVLRAVDYRAAQIRSRLAQFKSKSGSVRFITPLSYEESDALREEYRALVGQRGREGGAKLKLTCSEPFRFNTEQAKINETAAVLLGLFPHPKPSDDDIFQP